MATLRAVAQSFDRSLTHTLLAYRRKLLLKLQNEHFDILWIEKGDAIWPRTLRATKEVSPMTQIMSYTEDDMFAPHNRSIFYTRGLKYYDVAFTTKSYNCAPNELPSLGAKRVIFVDNAFDIHVHRPIPVTVNYVEALGGEVSFIRSYERERAESMLYLAKNGVSVRVWGNGWGCVPKLL